MKLSRSLVFVGVVALAGCGPLITQNPGQGFSPANAVSMDGESRLLLKGHDVVNYFTEGSHRMGSPEHRVEHAGVTFWFASAEHKALFEAEPDKYLPQYGGYCTNGIAYGIPWGGDANTWAMIDGKLYIFGGQASKDAFMLEPEKNLALADQYWNEEVEGSNAFFQRARRMVFKVPHYKSGSELAEEIARSKSQ